MHLHAFNVYLMYAKNAGLFQQNIDKHNYWVTFLNKCFNPTVRFVHIQQIWIETTQTFLIEWFPSAKNTLLFKIMKWVFYAHQGYIYLLKIQ